MGLHNPKMQEVVKRVHAPDGPLPQAELTRLKEVRRQKVLARTLATIQAQPGFRAARLPKTERWALKELEDQKKIIYRDGGWHAV